MPSIMQMQDERGGSNPMPRAFPSSSRLTRDNAALFADFFTRDAHGSAGPGSGKNRALLLTDVVKQFTWGKGLTFINYMVNVIV